MSLIQQKDMVRPANDNKSWYETNIKKRSIPNHLVTRRKTGFQVTSSQGKKDIKNGDYLESSESFNLVSFGGLSTRKIPPSEIRSRTSTTGNLYDTSSGDLTRFDDTNNKTINEELSIYDFDTDLPPSKSIYDLNDEILLSLDNPTPSDSFLTKDPKTYSSVFNSSGGVLSKPDLKEDNSKLNPLENGESAILVFGYPERMANQVIQQFQQFGTIMEDFEMNKSKHRNYLNTSDKILPIFSGPSWVKITYNNPASAMDSLQENGSIFNGVILGVIPYTKDAIEKLQNRKLTDAEDIGSGIENRSHNKTFDNESTSPVTNGSTATQSNITRIEIKERNNLFLTKDTASINDPAKPNTDTKKLNYWDTAMKYLFGFNEL